MLGWMTSSFISEIFFYLISITCVPCRRAHHLDPGVLGRSSRGLGTRGESRARLRCGSAQKRFIKVLSAQSLLVKNDSLLVTGQVTRGYQAKDPQMASYLKYVILLKETFPVFELVHVPREHEQTCWPNSPAQEREVARGQSFKRP